jgi:hypothetical protein
MHPILQIDRSKDIPITPIAFSESFLWCHFMAGLSVSENTSLFVVFDTTKPALKNTFGTK